MYSDRCKAFVCDLTQDDLTQNIPTPVQLVSAIFVLSAIPPEKMISALQNVWRVMRPGGVLVIRDYGLYDQAQLRFKPGHKMQDHLYVRSDGTLAYYFSLDRLNEVFTQAGFEPVEEARYVMTEVVNRKREVKMDRVFVQAKFRRPVT
jgi:methyltransferase-like protein 6